MNSRNLFPCLAILILGFYHTIFCQTTAFTYQGNLTSGGTAANGNHDLELALFTAVSAGTQLGATQTITNVPVTNGIFTVQVDFGNNFPGSNRFLEIRIRPSGGGTFTSLSPRQPITSTPYSIKSLTSDSAANATNAQQLNGTPANQYVLTGDVRLSDARNPLAGSSNYIQNQNAAPQPTSNFNISGNGTAGGTISGTTVNAMTQIDLGGSRVLHLGGDQSNENLFIGVNAGSVTTCCNTYVGFRAGALSTSNAVGNSFFGARAGEKTTSGQDNSFFGNFAGQNNTTGTGNTIFGEFAGSSMASGSFNAIFGHNAGISASGDFISLFGDRAASQGTLTHATAIGAHSLVTQSNSLVLGAINGLNFATSDTNVAIGTTAPAEKLHIAANGGNIVFGDPECAGFAAIGFVAPFDGCSNYALIGNASDTMLNRPAGRLFFREGNVNQMTIASGGNVGIGTTTPERKLHVIGPASIEIQIESSDAGGRKWTLQSSSAGNGGRFEIVDRTAVANRFTILDNGNVGLGTTAPADKLHVNGIVRVITLGAAGETPLCRNAANQISTCSSPRSYGNGVIEGVEYDRVSVVLLNAVREQQEQIKAQQKVIEELRAGLCHVSLLLDMCKGEKK